MSWIDNIYNSIASRMVDMMNQRGLDVLKTRSFREGNQPRQLKVAVEKGQYDDNLVINFTGLVEDRTISQMFGSGIKLDFEGDDENKTPQELFVQGMLKANKSERLFHNAKQFAGDGGTGYFMILPKGVIGDDGVEYPRIVAKDPAFMRIITDPDDIDIVLKYINEYKTQVDGRDIIKRQTTAREGTGWVTTYEESKNGGGTFEIIGEPEPMPYCPIIHWQNLPQPGCAEGKPDIQETDKALQNRINLVVSNISKITRLFAHPMRYVINAILGKLDTAPDSILSITGTDTKVGQFEPLGDLNAAMAFLKWLRQAYFDITRTVDIDSLEDKLGSLTNFALKVIYQDNESKINTMRLMMGEAIVELIMRCQVAAEIKNPLSCVVVWPDFIPVNAKEQTELALSHPGALFGFWQLVEPFPAGGIRSQRVAFTDSCRKWRAQAVMMIVQHLVISVKRSVHIDTRKTTFRIKRGHPVPSADNVTIGDVTGSVGLPIGINLDGAHHPHAIIKANTEGIHYLPGGCLWILANTNALNYGRAHFIGNGRCQHFQAFIQRAIHIKESGQLLNHARIDRIPSRGNNQRISE